MLVYMYTKPFGIFFGLNPQTPTQDASHHQDNHIFNIFDYIKGSLA